MATTLGSSRDRAYVTRLLGRLQHILLKKIHGFRVSGRCEKDPEREDESRDKEAGGEDELRETKHLHT